MHKTGWSRLSVYETRMFRDLKLFTAIKDDFKFMRQATDAIVDAKPLESSSQAPSVVSGGATESLNGKGKANSDSRSITPTMCIPFIGRCWDIIAVTKFVLNSFQESTFHNSIA